MVQEFRVKSFAFGMVALCLFASLLCSANARSGEAPPAPEMPAHWKAISDFEVPMEQVKTMGNKLGANIDSVRNTVYDVNGKRVQINVIVVPDSENAEKLMATLRSIKSEQALLQKGLVVYEFVGQNDALSVIEEGRRHLASM